jgi:hypothetical protein
VREFIRNSIKRIEYTYLVTGPYIDLYIGKLSQSPRAGSFDVVGKKATLLGSGDELVSFTTMKE